MDIANQIGWTLLASEKLADMEKKRQNDELQPGAYFSGGRGGGRPPQIFLGLVTLIIIIVALGQIWKLQCGPRSEKIKHRCLR